MGRWSSLHSFYTSDEWLNLRLRLMDEREDENGDIICDHCHKPIYNRDETIAHHTTMLTLDNFEDYDISLNPERIELVHHTCHNLIHNRWGKHNQHIYIIYGAPCSGKKTWVKDNATKDDVVIDMDLINAAITGGNMYDNSANTRGEVFAVRDFLYERITLRAMRKAHNIFIVGGFPRKAELEDMCVKYNATPIFMNVSKDECLMRLEGMTGIDKIAYRKYIEDWFFVHNY